MNKWICTALSTLFIVASAQAQEFDDMYFTKADREVLSAKPAAVPVDMGMHSFPATPERQNPQSRFSNPDGAGSGYGYNYYVTEEGVIPSSIPTEGNAYMEATQGMSIAEQAGKTSKKGGFFSNPSINIGMSAGTFGTGTSVGIGFGNNSAFQLGLGIGMGMGMGMYPGYGMGYPGMGWGMGYPGYGMGYPGMGWGMGYPGYGRGYPGMGWYDPMMAGRYPGMGWGYPGMGWGYRPIHVTQSPEQRAYANSVRNRGLAQSNKGLKYPSRYRTPSTASSGARSAGTPSKSQRYNNTRSSNPFNNNSYGRPSYNSGGSSFRASPSSGAGRSSGSAGRSVRRR
ncbi:hypothetical protein KMW28_17920 [Flammeovirga yaeyamensis]|uniref:Uncharacterized protein n=1 Tax=Flammeovirga yaeyamensis TaxID=367791 RepID=A0AAX1N5N8_9BACT|nr:hypothetical protein [Flammeovirga yaeyamensis]MBB3698098.1 hypothetical protein [Flammeovirga yaeyamensis]NMF34543.1 hypothetical protein [Flammeovirga yaeyamensis]QWG01520.1 hypothetical protein KMW28_17920 [Flammeovirga yaeyamensis]